MLGPPCVNTETHINKYAHLYRLHVKNEFPVECGNCVRSPRVVNTFHINMNSRVSTVRVGWALPTAGYNCEFTCDCVCVWVYKADYVWTYMFMGLDTTLAANPPRPEKYYCVMRSRWVCVVQQAKCGSEQVNVLT